MSVRRASVGLVPTLALIALAVACQYLSGGHEVVMDPASSVTDLAIVSVGFSELGRRSTALRTPDAHSRYAFPLFARSCMRQY
jgi:hypothetical protein